MTDAMLRQALSTFLGEARYREFVRKGFRRGRLLYWQEQEWARFTAAHPEMAVDLASLETALRVCHLHGDELQPDLVDVIDACIDLSPSYVEVRNRLFPHAALGPVSTEGRPLEAVHGDVWFCPTCRKAAEDWQARREKSPSGGMDRHLTRRTTLDEMAEFFRADTLKGSRASKWAALRREVEACLASGGELWEWESDGFRSFAGVLGVAVIRDGVWVGEWQLGRS